MEYKVIVVDATRGIIEGNSLQQAADNLAEQVNADIKAGWEPHGSVNFCETENENPHLMQAMVRKGAGAAAPANA